MNNTLQLKFLGAIGTVTGSCTAIKFSHEGETHYYLVDIGEYQGEKQNDEGRAWLARHAKQVEGIFITHAHYDHVGYLPELVMNHGFSKEIYCTKVTRELMESILEDSLKIKGVKTYNIKDVFNKIKFIDMDDNGKYWSVCSDFRVTTLNSAHILGSCIFLFQWKNGEEWDNLYFSGDIGANNEQSYSNILLKEFKYPYYENSPKINIVMESTYGNRIKKNKENLYEQKLEKLTEIIEEAVLNNRKVIFPAFALNRSQEILLDLFYLRSERKIGLKERIYNMQLNYLLKKNENKDIIQKILSLWKEYLPNSAIDWDMKICDLPEEMKNKMIQIYRYYYDATDHNHGNIRIHSNLMKKVNEIYNKYLLSTKEKKDRTLGYRYLSKYFFEKFNISNLNDREKFQEAKGIVNKILETKILHREKQSKKKENISPKAGQFIISSSGMCDEGMVIDLLKEILPDENAVVVLNGYQAVNTNGFHLKNMQNYSDNEKLCIELHNINLRLSEVKCKIMDLSEFYSGHADQDILFKFVTGDNEHQNKVPTRVFLNHGQNEARIALKERLETRENIKVEIPENLNWYNLNTGEQIQEENLIEKRNMLESDVRRFDIGDITVLIPNYYGEPVLQKIRDFLINIDEPSVKATPI